MTPTEMMAAMIDAAIDGDEDRLMSLRGVVRDWLIDEQTRADFEKLVGFCTDYMSKGA